MKPDELPCSYMLPILMLLHNYCPCMTTPIEPRNTGYTATQPRQTKA